MLTSRNVFSPMWSPLQQFQSEMNRLFDRWADNGGRTPAWSGYPPVNIWEDGNILHLEAELPGLALEDLEILVSSTTQLTIKGERKAGVPDKVVRHRQERGFGKFSRTFTLPFPVDPNAVTARFDSGVLQIDLAKHESAKPRKIVVKGE
jgi:HSP20 family protein